jgi:hypothetical protein
MMSKTRRAILGAAAAAVFAAGTAGAQVIPSLALPRVGLPPIGGVPVVGPVLDNIGSQPEARQVIQPTLDTVTGLPPRLAEAGPRTLLELRQLRLRTLIRENEAVLDADDRGQPVRRGIILVVDPELPSLQMAKRAGFRLLADERDAVLGLRTVKLEAPRGISTRSALKRLQKVAPRLQADFDHIYEPAGGSLAPLQATLAAAAGAARGAVIGMIDGGVASHPGLRSASIEQNGFAGSPQATGHGTAVASLLVGQQGPFRGAATGAQLYVADVYGGNRAAGSASVIARTPG